MTYSIKPKISTTSKMLRSWILFCHVASLTLSVSALPSILNSSSAIDGHQDSKQDRILANPILADTSLTDITNLTATTIGFPEYNTSNYREPTVLCHTNGPHGPVSGTWGHVNIYECGLLVMNMLAQDSAVLPAWQWSPSYPLVLPWTYGISANCRLKVTAIHPWSSDVFQRAMIAQRVSLIVSRCPNNKGGIVSLGPKQQFQVQVYGIVPRATT